MLSGPQWRIALVYLIVASLWILLSDTLLFLLGVDRAVVSSLSILKGIVFVAVTSTILFLLVGSEFAVRYRLEAELREQVEEVNRSKAALEQSQQFLSDIMAAAPNWTYVYDLVEDCIIFASAGTASLVGLKPDELRNMGLSALLQYVHPDDLSDVLVLYDKTRKVGSDTRDLLFECRLRHKDGTWRWAQIRAAIFKRSETGQVQHVIGSIIDITEAKLAELQLRVKDSAIASSITPFALADLEGRVTYVNRAFLKLWKLDNENQVVGRSVAAFWASPEAAQAIVQAISENDNHVGTLTARLADGNVAEVELTASMVKDERGRPICMMGSFYDVSQQKQAELIALEHERLKARFQKEQERNALVQRIISALSHDLRTPLTVISAAKDVLVHYYDRITPAIRMEKLDTIGRQVQFAVELLEDTVNMARGNLSETEYRPAPVNLAALCQVSVDEVRDAKVATQRLRFANLADIESARIDEVLVSRILLNLLSNAIKYSPEYSEVRLELDCHDSWIVLRVIDQGMGIREADLPYIFDPFFRAEDAASVRGTGLGLSIVKDCVERHHGRISVDSVLGKGSTFTVELPLELISPTEQVAVRS